MKPIRSISRGITLVTLSLLSHAALAQEGGGLANATSAARSVLTDLRVLVPVLFTIGLIIVAVLYAKRMIGKEAFWNWGVGIAIGGSASTLVAALWGS